MSKNRLEGLPPGVAGLTNLTIVDLRENALRDVPPLPPSRRLDQLLLGFNRISKVNAEFVADVPCLTVLDLSDNSIVTVPDDIGRLKALATVRVDAKSGCLRLLLTLSRRRPPMFVPRPRSWT